MPSKKQPEMKTWWDYISNKVDDSKELDANFNIVKIHLLFHWVEQICQYSAFQL